MFRDTAFEVMHLIDGFRWCGFPKMRDALAHAIEHNASGPAARTRSELLLFGSGPPVPIGLTTHSSVNGTRIPRLTMSLGDISRNAPSACPSWIVIAGCLAELVHASKIHLSRHS